MSLKTLIAMAVFCAAVASLVIMWALFFTMWLHGAREITLYVDYFGEFWIEFVALTLAMIFLPILVYEFDQQVIQQ